MDFFWGRWRTAVNGSDLFLYPHITVKYNIFYKRWSFLGTDDGAVSCSDLLFLFSVCFCFFFWLMWSRVFHSSEEKKKVSRFFHFSVEIETKYWTGLVSTERNGENKEKNWNFPGNTRHLLPFSFTFCFILIFIYYYKNL